MGEIDLINWRMVAVASLWVSGLAMLLAIFGFVYYQSKTQGRSIRTTLRQVGYQAWINLGLSLLSLGMMATAQLTLEMILWGVMALVFLLYSGTSFWKLRAERYRKNGDSKLMPSAHRKDDG